MTTIRPQKEFPLLERYREVFDITDRTIFAYNDVIYCDGKLPPDLIVHEKVHHKQQKRVGLDRWVELFLTDPKFRLEQEIEAYTTQLRSITDRNYKMTVYLSSAKALSSSLYGNIISYEEALEALK